MRTGRQRPGLTDDERARRRRLAQPVRRLRSSDAVLWSSASGVAAAVYALVHRGPHWQVVLAAALTIPFTATGWAAAARRWRDPPGRDVVFAGGTLVAIATLTVMALADGENSPLVALFFPLAAFIAVSVSTATVLGLLAVILTCYLVATGDEDVTSMCVRAVSLLGLAFVSMVQARVQRRARRSLRDASLRDALTELPNRALLSEKLHHAIERVRRQPELSLAIAFIDLDDFKAVNDTLGHRAGDELLRIVAPRLQGAVRATDTLARFGGDEFVVLMEDLDTEDEALVVAERLLRALAEPAQLGSSVEHVRGSVGLVMGDRRYWDDPDALLRDADTAMYRAKAKGGGRCEVFDEATRERVLTRVRLERELRHAIEAGDQFHVLYQPVVDLGTGAITRAEALLRWHRPDGETVPTSVFVAAAEQAGLIGRLGEWVLRQACAQAVAWRAQDGLEAVGVSVNVSASQVGPRQDLPGLVSSVMTATGIDPGALALEITETMLVESPVEAAATFRELAGMGLGVDLDDFGTGYSSLSSVRSFPLTTIKLDRSFVAEVAEPRNLAIVRSVVELTHALGMVSVAEGVETHEQLRVLVELGCDQAQGFLFAPALEPAAFVEVATAGFAAVLAGAPVAHVSGAPE